MSRGLSGFERPPRWAVITTAVCLAVMAGLALVDRPPPPAYEGLSVAEAYPSPADEVPTPKRQIADAVALLDDPVRPFTVAVISDSTGAAGASWVHQLADWLGETYDRPVTMHAWAVETEPDGYQKPWSLHSGSNAPVEMWNGSAGGQNVDYSTEHLDEMIPIPAEQVDLMIFSHGHNEGPGQLVASARDFLSSATQTYSNATVAVMLQNPERPDMERAARHDENMVALAAWATAQGFPVIDGHAAYRAMPGWEDEFADETGLHPTERGYETWGRAVTDAFAAARPTG